MYIKQTIFVEKNKQKNIVEYSIFNASIYFHFFSKKVAGEFNDDGEEVGI